jgi:hypothetical protein
MQFDHIRQVNYRILASQGFLSKMSVLDKQNHRIYTANMGSQLYIRLRGYDQLSDLHVITGFIWLANLRI